MWIAIYVALFYPRRALLLQTALIPVSFGAALLVNGMPHMFPSWLIVSITAIVASAALNHQSLRQRALAVTDPLTGLANRNGLMDAVTRELALSQRTGSPSR